MLGAVGRLAGSLANCLTCLYTIYIYTNVSFWSPVQDVWLALSSKAPLWLCKVAFEPFKWLSPTGQSQRESKTKTALLADKCRRDPPQEDILCRAMAREYPGGQRAVEAKPTPFPGGPPEPHIGHRRYRSAEVSGKGWENWKTFNQNPFSNNHDIYHNINNKLTMLSFPGHSHRSSPNVYAAKMAKLWGQLFGNDRADASGVAAGQSASRHAIIGDGDDEEYAEEEDDEEEKNDDDDDDADGDDDGDDGDDDGWWWMMMMMMTVMMMDDDGWWWMMMMTMMMMVMMMMMTVMMMDDDGWWWWWWRRWWWWWWWWWWWRRRWRWQWRRWWWWWWW